MQFARDHAMTALIFGAFASSWFGWAQERPPRALVRPLIAGAVLSLAVAVTGGVLAVLHWSTGSALSEPGAMKRYGVIVGIEFGVAAFGVLALALRKQAHLFPTWVCLVVGVHFWPMAPVLRSPALRVLAVVMVVVALAAWLVARRWKLPLSATTGVGAGVTLLIAAALALLGAATS
ncbi:hypothetical protein [Micromonospora sp. NPDC023956]|uniref:hypothetical protein n=1 Tax=Micromonospora sp. NPDC023956 TaxID=3155722 RepID=UPI0033E4DC2B